MSMHTFGSAFHTKHKQDLIGEAKSAYKEYGTYFSRLFKVLTISSAALHSSYMEA